MQTYTGSCQCGAVKYEVQAELSQVIACNCSICHKHGLLLAFVPDSQFTLLSGADVLTEYRFNKKQIQHQFCRTCGVESFAAGQNADGTGSYAINVRCLDGIDISTLTVVPYDGKSL